jgi:hypothetical protein
MFHLAQFLLTCIIVTNQTFFACTCICVWPWISIWEKWLKVYVDVLSSKVSCVSTAFDPRVALYVLYYITQEIGCLCILTCVIWHEVFLIGLYCDKQHFLSISDCDVNIYDNQQFGTLLNFDHNLFCHCGLSWEYHFCFILWFLFVDILVEISDILSGVAGTGNCASNQFKLQILLRYYCNFQLQSV